VVARNGADSAAPALREGADATADQSRDVDFEPDPSLPQHARDRAEAGMEPSVDRALRPIFMYLREAGVLK